MLLSPAVQGAAFVPGSEPDPPTGPPAAPTVTDAQAGEPLQASGFRWQLGPWRRSGQLNLDTRLTQDQGGRLTRSLSTSGDVEYSSYLWQPWFAQLRLGAGLVASRGLATGGVDDSAGNTGMAWTGRVGLALFPASRFPLELRADVSDSRSNGDTLLNVVRTQRLSLTQSYRPLDANRSLQLILDFSRLSSGGSSDALSNLQVMGQEQQGDHQYELSGSFAAYRQSQSTDRNWQSQVTARHGFHPGSSWQVDTLANWSEQRQRSGDGGLIHQGTDTRQISTLVSWRPGPGEGLNTEERTLNVAATARWLELRSVSQDKQRGQALNATLGASLDFAQTWRAGLVAAMSRVDASDGGTLPSYNLGGNLSWNPAMLSLGGWSYVGSVSGSGGMSVVGDAPWRKQVGLQGMHSISRDWALGEEQRLALSLSQNASALRQSGVDTVVRALSHGASLFWQGSAGEDGQRFAGLSLSDSLSLAQTRGRFQMVNLQMSQRMLLSRQTSWSINLTAQATRNDDTQIDPITGDRRVQATGWQRFINGGASLEQQRLFGVPRLRHALQFNISSQQLERREAGDIDAPRERISHLVESRLDYAIGRLEARLSARIARVEGRSIALLQARVMRRF